MVGVAGRSGGARPGAGKKPKPPPKTVVMPEGMDMLDFLMKVALGHVEASPLQVRAAQAAVQYTHPKMGEGGKKDAKQKAAEEATAGRFSGAAAPPKLRAVK